MTDRDFSFFVRVWETVRQIPPGRVTTYGRVARRLGSPRLARVVGYALHGAPDGLPCHRVVNRKGELSAAFFPEGRATHRLLLEAEGVPFTEDGRVALDACIWDFDV